MALEYFLLKPDGEQTGTYSIEQVKKMLATGFIDTDTRYWFEGATDWLPVDQIDESLKFVEAHPPAPKTGPPPRTKLSGSLARAVPSPHQKQAASSKSLLSTARPKLATFADEVLPSGPEIPEPVLAREMVAGDETALPPVPDEETPVLELPPAPAPRRRIRRRLYAIPLVILVVVLAWAGWWSTHSARPDYTHVTLPGRTAFALVDQGSIKAFEDEMQNSTVAEVLRHQIDDATDPVMQQKLGIGLQKENEQHSGEVTVRYIKDNRAMFVEAGTYAAVAYFDDNGTLTLPRDGAPWVAVVYRDNIVFVYQGTAFTLAPP